MDFSIVAKPDVEVRSGGVGPIMFGGIWLVIDGAEYPAAGWTDNQLVLVSGWTHNFIELMLGRNAFCTNFFMEGPYSFTVTKISNGNLAIECGSEFQHRAVISAGEYRSALHNSLTTLLATLRENARCPTEINSIVRGVDLLAARLSDVPLDMRRREA